MTLVQARAEICRVGKSLFDRGYVHATAGNISVRLSPDAGGGFLITPTDACLGFLDPDRLAHVDLGGKHVSGDTPSKTIGLHRRIYQACDAAKQPVGCVIHTHSTHCVALTLQPKPEDASQDFPDFLPPITPYFVMKVGHVPLIPYAAPGSQQAVDWVADAIETQAAKSLDIRAAMLTRLGPIVWHNTPARAMAVLEELEETARLHHWSGQTALPLTSDQLAELQAIFGSTW